MKTLREQYNDALKAQREATNNIALADKDIRDRAAALVNQYPWLCKDIIIDTNSVHTVFTKNKIEGEGDAIKIWLDIVDANGEVSVNASRFVRVIHISVMELMRLIEGIESRIKQTK